MSELDEKQGQTQILPPVLDDKLPSDYNAETEIDDHNQLHENDGKTNIKFESQKFAHRKSIQEFALKMYFVFKEAAIMLLLALAYAALTNDPPKISKSPAAYPFFPKTSIITDWYRGQLSAAIEKARESDIAFIMFYAPWDAESQAVRKEFDLAARYMQKQITFAAINCWQPGSECRRQYTKAYNWPVLIAYPAHGKGIQYKGLRTAEHMVKFLTSLTRPLKRLSSEAEVHDLLASYDAVVLGCVNASPGSLEYAVLYTAALRFLEKDPYQEVAFAVLTGSLNKCSYDIGPSLTLHMWNETLRYPKDNEWKPDPLLSWILKSIHQVNMWITPIGSKSLTLSTYLQPGPSLVLFTPRNTLHSFTDYYDLLHEIGLEYYNCEDKGHIKLNSFLIHTKRIDNYLKYKDFLKSCVFKTNNSTSKFPSVVTFTIPQKWANNSCCLVNSKLSKDACSKCDAMDLLKDRLSPQCKLSEGENECAEFYQHHSFKKQDLYKFCDSNNFDTKDSSERKTETSILNDDQDYRSPKNLQKLWKKEKCRMAIIAQETSPLPISETITNPKMPENLQKKKNISGFACKTNSSLTLIALDSLKLYHFAERLGINLSTKKDKTAAVIIYEKMETHHILEKPINDHTLREFIFNFSTNSLPRAFSSALNTRSKHTHVYRAQSSQIKCPSEVCLQELTTENFLSTVMQQDKTVMVLYYSKQCSFCSGISYTFLTTAKMFSSLNSIRFTRIDGDLNTLPWEFTMDTYPTIIFFPARSKSESRVFPQNMPVTVPNLISFILANVHQNLKLHIMWTICNQTTFDDEKQSCMASVRAENLSLIGHTLRAWRNANFLTRKKLLYKLQQLRNLNLLLAHYPQNIDTIQKYMETLQLTLNELKQSEKGYRDKQSDYIRNEL